jgi:hypothetical protein
MREIVPLLFVIAFVIVGLVARRGWTMSHLRITGIGWTALGFLGAFACGIDFISNWMADGFGSAVESDLVGLLFCIPAAFAGYGTFRHRPWARLLCAIVGVVLLLYATSYLLMVGLEFGIFPFVLICMAAVFSVYTLFAISRIKPTA